MRACIEDVHGRRAISFFHVFLGKSNFRGAKLIERSFLSLSFSLSLELLVQEAFEKIFLASNFSWTENLCADFPVRKFKLQKNSRRTRNLSKFYSNGKAVSWRGKHVTRSESAILEPLIFWESHKKRIALTFSVRLLSLKKRFFTVFQFPTPL